MALSLESSKKVVVGDNESDEDNDTKQKRRGRGTARDLQKTQLEKLMANPVNMTNNFQFKLSYCVSMCQ